MRYELWHVESANLIDDFAAEDEALSAARDYLAPDEQGEAVDVALVVSDAAGHPIRSIEGAELAALVVSQSLSEARRTA